MGTLSAAEIFSDLLLLQKPAPRVWWYQESPSLEIWGRSYYNQTLSWIKNQELKSLVMMTWGIPDKYHCMSVVNMAEIVMICLMILTPSFVLLQGGVTQCSTAACWDPWWWWDEEIWFKTSHKGSALGLQEGAEEAGANLVLSMSHELKDMVLTLNIFCWLLMLVLTVTYSIDIIYTQRVNINLIVS